MVIIVICDPYFFLVRRDMENWWHFFGLSKIGSQVSFPMTEVEASSKNFRRLPECNIQFQMMLFESLRACSHEPGAVNYPGVMIAPG